MIRFYAAFDDLTTTEAISNPSLVFYCDINPDRQVGGVGAVTDHDALNNLDYANSGHMGFEPAKGIDDNYVTDTEKAALHSHSNKTALDNVSGINTGDQTLPVKNTGAEINTGTDDAKFTTAKSLTDSKYNTFEVPYALDSQQNDATVGTKITDYFAFAFSLTSIRCNLKTAPTGATLFTIDIKKNGASIFTTKITFDAGEVNIIDPTTPYVLVNNPTAWAVNDKIEILIDSVGSSVAGTGPIIYLIGIKI